MNCNLRTVVILSLTILIFGVLSTAQELTPYRLTLRDAIQKAMQANLNVLVADTKVEEAEGTRMRRLSAALLPRVRVQSYANYQNRSLSAFGITAPGFPAVIGPFSNYDFRFYADQNIVDLQSYRGWKASERALDASKMDYRDARDLIIRAVASLYLNAQSAAARVDAAQSRVTDSDVLYKLAKDKHDAGTATGVDVLRSQVQLANDKQALLVAQNQYKQSLLALARNLGMRPSTPLELAESLRYQPLEPLQAKSLVPTALFARPDYLSLASQRLGLVEQQRASRARYYPKLSINGNYGELGRSIGGMQGIGMIQGQMDFTVFDRDRRGEAQELASGVKRIDDQIADLRRGIEEDIDEALLNLESAAQQVAVAKEGQDLAQRELELSQDRFQSGTTNNVEVVTAQDELARAQENYILAVTSHVDAKFALARAVGDTEKDIGQYLGNP
ncbi:MAG TPA: TolC family protein [Terriglobales bacterium]|nr:TolC family protein [Terriglobales bacterium]